MKNFKNNQLGAKLSYAVEIAKYFKRKKNVGKVIARSEGKINGGAPEEKESGKIVMIKKPEPEEIFEDDSDDDRDLK